MSKSQKPLQKIGDKEYDRKEFMEVIEASAEYIKKADDAGSVDFEFSRMWDYFHQFKDNGLDEHGGI